MSKYVRALLCSILSVAIIFSCFSFQVSADTTKTIELDQYLHIETECDAYKKYKLIIPQTTYYNFRVLTTGVKFDPKDIDGSLYESLKNVKTPVIHIFNGNGTEFLNDYKQWWQSGVAASDSVKYVEKGEYDFYITSTENCKLIIDGFDGEIYITKDGQKIDDILVPVNEFLPDNYLYDEDGTHDFKVVVKPGSRGRKYTICTTIFLDSERDLDETVVISVDKDKSYTFVPIYFTDDNQQFAFCFRICKGGTPDILTYKDGSYRNYLSEVGKTETIGFECERKDITIGDASINDELDIGNNKSVTINHPNAYFVHFSTPAFIYCFIKDKSSKNVIELDKTYDASPALFSSKCIGSQLVYSFTPSKDSVYNLSSTGLGANPYVAVFDSSDNCIGWYDSNKNATDYFDDDYLSLIQKGDVDFNLNLDLELKANQTYYFYFTNSYCYQLYSYDYITFDFSSANPYCFKMSEKNAEAKNTEEQPSTPNK